MGKDRNKKLEAPGSAFARMNYLYQASHLISKGDMSNPLSNYYNKVLKEISKKMVEKLHPDLKRTMCAACNYPLVVGSEQICVKIKTHKKKKKEKKNKISFDLHSKKFFQKFSMQYKTNKYSKCQIAARNKKPNKLWWSCYKCGFSKGYSQEPSYKLWISQMISGS